MRRIAVILGLILATPAWAADPQVADRTGAEIFATVCSMCHVEETPRMRAPSIEALRRLTTENIKDALTLGEMMDVGSGLSDKEISNIAAFLTTPPPKPGVDKTTP